MGLPHTPWRRSPSTAPVTGARWLAMLAVSVWLAGCTTVPVEFVTLSGAVRGESTVLSGTVPADAMQLQRGNAGFLVVPEMRLERDDVLLTGPDTTAVVSFPGGARAYLYPGTQVRIGSLFEAFGKVFVKVRGAFTVKTAFVTAGSEGTQYWVEVDRDAVRVVVAEDHVALSSNDGAWPPWRLEQGRQALFRGAAAGRPSAADPVEIRREQERVARLDRLVPVKTTLSPIVVPLVVIGTGVLIHESGRGSSPPKPSDGASPAGTGDAGTVKPPPTDRLPRRIVR